MIRCRFFNLRFRVQYYFEKKCCRPVFHINIYDFFCKNDVFLEKNYMLSSFFEKCLSSILAKKWSCRPYIRPPCTVYGYLPASFIIGSPVSKPSGRAFLFINFSRIFPESFAITNASTTSLHASSVTCGLSS